MSCDCTAASEPESGLGAGARRGEGALRFAIARSFAGVSCTNQAEAQGVSAVGRAGAAWGLTARRSLAGAPLFHSTHQ